MDSWFTHNDSSKIDKDECYHYVITTPFGFLYAVCIVGVVYSDTRIVSLY